MRVQNLTGQTLGQYELLELLGAGGMGAVYRGYQANLKRFVAIKVISTELVSQPGYLERFNREAETSATLEHPHIITIHDYGIQQQISYLVMQLLSGGSLAERLQHHHQSANPLPSLREVADLLKQISSALDYAHSQGVIHRDIKLSNVMFDNHGMAYLVDFGIAKLVQSSEVLTASGVMVGTLAYMAPEQWRNDSIVAATDQYALGVMTYRLVSGQMPFESATPAGLMYKHLNEMPTPPHVHRPDIPGELTLVVERALAKYPEERFPTCTGFAQAFASAIESKVGENTQFFLGSLERKSRITMARASGVNSKLHIETRANIRPVYQHPVMWMMASVLVVAFAVIVFLLAKGGKTEEQNPIFTPSIAAGAVGATTSPPPSPTRTATMAVTVAVQASAEAQLTRTAVQWPLTPVTLVVETIDNQVATLAPQEIGTPSPTAVNLLQAPSPSFTPPPTPTILTTQSPTPSVVPTKTASSPPPSPSATATTTLPMKTSSPTASALPTYSPTPSPLPTETLTKTPTVMSTSTSTPRPSRTPRPTPMPLSIPEMPSDALIYEENFEDGTATDWTYNQHYSVIDDGSGNLVWRAIGNGNVFLSPSQEWENYLFEINYVVLDWGDSGGWSMDLRGMRNNRRWYNLWIGQDWMGLAERAGTATVATLAGEDIYHFGDKWHLLRVMVQGSTVKWQRDNGQVLTARVDDESGPGIGLFTWNTEEVWFDDIRVWKVE